MSSPNLDFIKPSQTKDAHEEHKSSKQKGTNTLNDPIKPTVTTLNPSKQIPSKQLTTSHQNTTASNQNMTVHPTVTTLNPSKQPKPIPSSQPTNKPDPSNKQDPCHHERTPYPFPSEKPDPNVTFNPGKITTFKHSPMDFLFISDSSGSMSGKKWEALLKALGSAIDEIEKFNTNHKITVINFSDFAATEGGIQLSPEKARNIVKSMGQQKNGGTDFAIAFAEALCCIKKMETKKVVVVFLSDGEALYPETEVKALKSYIQDNQLAFRFYTIGFEVQNDILKKMAEKFHGQDLSNISQLDLMTTYKKIITQEMLS
jgi:uncharacterized protein YegL